METDTHRQTARETKTDRRPERPTHRHIVRGSKEREIQASDVEMCIRAYSQRGVVGSVAKEEQEGRELAMIYPARDVGVLSCSVFSASLLACRHTL